MSNEKKELINIINELPDNKKYLQNIINYIAEMKINEEMNEQPEELNIKDIDDLNKKLDEGLKDIENGEIYTIDEVMSAIKTW